MAIDRGPWNALVDDDGSNLVGSIWNKAAIKTVLLDPIDTAFGIWQDVPFSAANFSFTVTAGNVLGNRFSRVGNTLTWAVLIDNASTVGGSTSMDFQIPSGATVRTAGQNPTIMFSGGQWTLGQLITTNGLTSVRIFKIDFSAFAAGRVDFSFTVVFEVNP